MAKKAAPVATSRVCPKCNVAGPVRLMPGQLCTTCTAGEAWSAIGDQKLVIDHATIDQAVLRRQGEDAADPAWKRALIWVPPALSVLFAVAATWFVLKVLSSHAIGPLDSLLDDLLRTYRLATLAGFAALAAGIVALMRLRKQRHFRKVPHVIAHALPIVAGATALVVGGFHWVATGYGFGQYTSMPTRTALGMPAHIERVIDATVVVLAPDASGDARMGAIGTGAVVAGDDTRAWIVTCSHVAMPYAAVGGWRHAKDAQPVWVQLADGRGAEAKVRWAAPPPLDVVLLEMPMASPPRPVPIAPDASGLQKNADVTFVPNPYRSGWHVVHGKLIQRETHTTPAGAYDLLYTDLPVTHGDSGSGLFDARGQLVGLNTWTRIGEGVPAQGISLPSETMRVLVDAIQNGTIDKLDDAIGAPPTAGAAE